MNGIVPDPTSKDYFENPEILPPFEFYNDLQDVIRCFIGGKRTTQKGYHSKNIPNCKLHDRLKKYLGSFSSN
ncbi:MAG: hypothetical protein HOJ35_08100 [Bdellovibrionales bacterium]|nr:hypothetical protein [Bdellovibrionales bacterium]